MERHQLTREERAKGGRNQPREAKVRGGQNAFLRTMETHPFFVRSRHFKALVKGQYSREEFNNGR